MREIERANLASRAYEQLRASLMAGEFEPGERLTLRMLSDRLGTSQTPIREALMQLVAERALTVEPGRSPRVPNLTLSRFLELRDIRVALETLAARNAVAHANPELLRDLRKVHDRMMRAKIARNFKDTLALNRAFHFRLYRAAGQETLLSMIEALWVQTGPFLNFLYPGPPLSESGHHMHEDVLRGLKDGDADLVAEAIRKDIVQGGAAILDHLTDTEAV
ncbi:MAG: GntR family transcriptional regulator [Alphaproteobacteria bacterium]|nr:GntR family transcriptional regulator [Alphaproteobacteria bacterium]MDX5369829.1 GntR family transcriptional regulator [Alphaproteobacteria bacterium]